MNTHPTPAERLAWRAARVKCSWRRAPERHGAAVVEFALCLPLLVMLVFGVIEASNAVFLQQALTSAAYEAANVASAIGGTSAAAEARANEVLDSLGIQSATVQITPTVTPATPVGTMIVITCSAPLAANSAFLGYLGQPVQSAQLTIPRL